MKNGRLLSIALLSLVSITCGAQTMPNFKPFIKNAALTSANEYAVKELLDSTINKFLSIANNDKSHLHKIIQDEFANCKQLDRLKSYVYPTHLTKKCLTIQFIDWSDINGLTSADSAWSSSTLTSIILIPLMIEEQKGNSVENLCFKTELEISNSGKLDATAQKPQIDLKIQKINIASLEGTTVEY